jgi:hypothetical protein
MGRAAPTGSLAERIARANLGSALSVFAAWIAQRNLSPSVPVPDEWLFFWAPVALWLVSMGLLCWGQALIGHKPAVRDMIRASWAVGWAAGAVGLAIGLLASLAFYWDEMLGPALGVIFTGPVGFMAGAFAMLIARVVWRDPGGASDSSV